MMFAYWLSLRPMLLFGILASGHYQKVEQLEQHSCSIRVLLGTYVSLKIIICPKKYNCQILSELLASH